MDLVVCTIGQRDLCLNGQTAQDLGEEDRAFGKRMLDHFDDFSDRLSAPILERSLDYLVHRDTGPLHLQLLCSDQPEGTLERYRRSDTRPAAETIKRLWETGHATWTARSRIQKIFVKSMASNPASLDIVVEWLAREGGPAASWAGYDGVWACATGGTPAMTAGLQLAAVALGERAHVLYALEGRPVRELAIIERGAQARRRANVRAEVSHYRFGAAADLVRIHRGQLGLAPSTDAALERVARSGERRLAFDLAEARRGLTDRGIPGLSPQTYESIDALATSVPSDEVGLLSELYHNALLKLKLGEFADFVVRLFSLYPALLRHALMGCGVRFGNEGESFETTWLDENLQVKEFTAAWGRPDSQCEPVLLDRGASVLGLLCVTDYLASLGRLSPGLARSARKLYPLNRLRNKSFAVHSFEPVGQSQVTNAFGASLDHLRQEVAVLFQEAVGIGPRADPLELTAEVCQNLLGPD